MSNKKQPGSPSKNPKATVDIGAGAIFVIALIAVSFLGAAWLGLSQLIIENIR